MQNRFVRLASIRRHTLVAVLAVAAPLVALAAASSALATPKGEFAVFAGCPVSHPGLNACLVAKTESGKFIVGKKTVPIKNTITLQGGFIENRETHAEEFVGAAEGYETLSKTPQEVPGGLFGIECGTISNKYVREACEFVFKNKFTEVTATTELAAPASSIFLSEPALLNPILSEAFGIPALALPVKVKLSNFFLGEACYLGSEAHPIVLSLITGKTNPPKPNEPITGNPGTLSSNSEGTILTISENSLVNNSFGAPEATGCGGAFSAIVDPLVDAILGVPSAEGTNTAILNGTLKQAGRAAVEESE
jgi:hypothetical protein